ncbi:MAG TPA: YeeE/YedE thiosulfate transporter family protein [Gemmatimonadaceae bacterium]|nr:YeeE/YedE thiosulfate transporter family protein [Gemmatimonadaceae bacterium]
MAPLYELGRFGDGTSLVIAVALGSAFGWFLERGGMGSARKLAGQFYFNDLSVLKLMFSAIVTAMLGLFWLSWAGLLDLTRVYVPETFIAPQIVGGLVFGVGFAAGGLCPGTSCVAAATGRRDGFALIAGMLVGVFAFGEAFPVIGSFAESTARGAWTLPQALGLSYGTVVGIIVAAALGAFVGAERLERRV